MSFNFEIESIEFTTMGSAERGKWITKQNSREFEPGEYTVRVTSGSERKTLVEATIVVDHDEEIQRVPHPLDPPDWRESDDFALFWLGEDFDGIPLRSFCELRNGQVDFIYGGCTIIGWNEGCGIPLSVTIKRCETLHEFPPTEVRGVPAAKFQSQIDIWTKDALIQINAMSPEQALDAAQALLPFPSNGPASSSEDLGPADQECLPRPFPTNRPPP
ncbi:MAG: hypothetical protein IH957_04195 [Chloroflexi bacterium]|nr:hypothetical protein [Chloroflexota bacterium]